MKRREFLKYMGIGAGAAMLPSCVSKSESAAVMHKTGPMTTRINHNTGDTVSILGFGCMRLPVIQGADDTVDEIDQEEVNRLVDKAIEGGVNYFDTSPAYCKGRSEHAMGIALSRHPRKSYFLATKMSNFDPSTWSRDASMEIYRNSLKELQTDYLDYMLLHAVGGSTDTLSSQQVFDGRYIDNGILDFLVEEKKAWRIRNLGFSYHGDVAVFDRLLKMMDEGKVHWDFVQIQHNYIDWNHAKEINERNTDSEYLYGELASRNIPVVVMEPLLGGRLAKVQNAIAVKMKQRRPDDSVASWAFRFAGTQPQILTVLSGMTYMDHLEDNLRTYSSLEPVTEDEQAFLHEIAVEILRNNEVPCTGCGYCMPCPYGLDIPGIFAHYNKCINDDNVPRDSRSERYAEARRAYLIGYDRSVPRLRQASHCIDCGACAPRCPQDIAIPARLSEIDTYTRSLRNNTI